MPTCRVKQESDPKSYDKGDRDKMKAGIPGFLSAFSILWAQRGVSAFQQKHFLSTCYTRSSHTLVW
jgi:hypothetical protein